MDVKSMTLKVILSKKIKNQNFKTIKIQRIVFTNVEQKEREKR